MTRKQLLFIALLLSFAAATADTLIVNHDVIRFVIVSLLCVENGRLIERASRKKTSAKAVQS